MAIGDQLDFVRRLRGVLPVRWFPDTAPGATTSSPVLDSALNALAAVWAQIYGLVIYARTQSRIGSATDVWLDLISLDFFNLALPRRAGEADTSFRNRIKTRLLRYTATRQAIITGLTILTGRTPLIIEPWNNGDCGSWDALVGPYNGGIMAYSTSGAWGSILLPYQFFVQVKRQNLGGIIGVQGYTAQPQMVGGYGVGAIEYVSAAMVGATVQDADIYQTILDLKAEGTIAWVNISS